MGRGHQKLIHHEKNDFHYCGFSKLNIDFL